MLARSNGKAALLPGTRTVPPEQPVALSTKPAPPSAEQPAPVPVVPTVAKETNGVEASRHHAVARELLSKGDLKGAIAELDLAIDGKKDFPLAYNARGYAWLLLKDYKRAVADFDAAIRLKPDYANAYTNRSVARRNLGDADGGKADAARAASLLK
jgi:tetratricopeptide (TPR) repeat protein